MESFTIESYEINTTSHWITMKSHWIAMKSDWITMKIPLNHYEIPLNHYEIPWSSNFLWLNWLNWMKPSPKVPPLVKPMAFSTNPLARHYKRHHEVQKAHLNSWNSAVLYVIFHHWIGFSLRENLNTGNHGNHRFSHEINRSRGFLYFFSRKPIHWSNSSGSHWGILEIHHFEDAKSVMMELLRFFEGDIHLVRNIEQQSIKHLYGSSRTLADLGEKPNLLACFFETN